MNKHIDEKMQTVLDTLLDLMVSQVLNGTVVWNLVANFLFQVSKIEWRDRYARQQQCFSFLLEKFKKFYLPHIFPQFSNATSLYKLNLGIRIH